MRKSLFRKYFAVTCTVIAVSFAVLGLLLMAMIRDFWLDDRLTRLRETAVQASALAKNMLADGFSAEQIAGNLRTLADVTDADIFIVSLRGEHYMCSDADAFGRCRHEANVPGDIVSQAVSGEYGSVGTLGALYDSPHYTVGVPFWGPDRENAVLGAVFASAPADELNRFIFDVLRLFLLASLIVVFIALVAVWAVTRRMILPLRQMVSAARAMAEGDFSRHIRVETEDEIGELAHAFNEMTTSLASLEQMRRSFIGNVSHELKTPMTTIAGFIDGILDGTIGPEKQKQYLLIVSDEIKRLSRLVNSMLSLSKLESGELKLNPVECDLREILIRILLSLEKRIDDKSLEIEGLEDVESVKVTADPDLIHQVIYNLTDNAVKFAPEKGYIRFAFRDTPTEVRMSIRNNGAGIAPTELPHVFERFYKTDRSRSMDKSGTGLGLYIAKSIVNIHGGRITARSIPGDFTEFEFSLPKIL